METAVLRRCITGLGRGFADHNRTLWLSLIMPEAGRATEEVTPCLSNVDIMCNWVQLGA